MIITIQSKDGTDDPEVMSGTCPTLGDAVGQYQELQSAGFDVRVLIDGCPTEWTSGRWFDDSRLDDLIEAWTSDCISLAEANELTNRLLVKHGYIS